jgi:protein-disulfide isomerase
VLPFIEKDFVETGKVELIFLDHPLNMHPHAFKAAEAAACAADQGKFWDMYIQLFDFQRELAPEQLVGHAEEIGLDMAAFRSCFSGGKKAAGIREDIRVAESLGLSGTPAYLIGRRIAGGDKVEVLEIVKGLPTYEALEEKLNALLPPVAAPPPSSQE